MSNTTISIPIDLDSEVYADLFEKAIEAGTTIQDLLREHIPEILMR